MTITALTGAINDDACDYDALDGLVLAAVLDATVTQIVDLCDALLIAKARAEWEIECLNRVVAMRYGTSST